MKKLKIYLCLIAAAAVAVAAIIGAGVAARGCSELPEPNLPEPNLPELNLPEPKLQSLATDDIYADARRRDFKCNAVYYDIKRGELCDPLGGIEDIKNIFKIPSLFPIVKGHRNKGQMAGTIWSSSDSKGRYGEISLGKNQ